MNGGRTKRGIYIVMSNERQQLPMPSADMSPLRASVPKDVILLSLLWLPKIMASLFAPCRVLYVIKRYTPLPVRRSTLFLYGPIVRFRELVANEGRIGEALSALKLSL